MARQHGTLLTATPRLTQWKQHEAMNESVFGEANSPELNFSE